MPSYTQQQHTTTRCSRLILAALLTSALLFFLYSSTPPAPACSSIPDNAIALDTQRLLALHATVWKLLKLSPTVQDELQQLVRTTNTPLYSHNLKQQQQHNQPHTPAATPTSRTEFLERHRQRLIAVGLSRNAVDELVEVLSAIWRGLYDPNAYQDPSFDADLAAASKVLFEHGPPKCCNDSLYSLPSS